MTLLELQKKIDKAAYAYYTIGVAIVDDSVYDGWIDELKKLNPNDIRLKRVGFDVGGTILSKVKHEIPMGSQDKAVDRVEFDNWIKNNLLKSGVSKNEKFIASHKMDGMSISLTFKNDKLVDAVSRGDGIIGERLFQNALLFKGIPKSTNHNFSGFVRGEIVLNVDDWDKVDSNKSSNPRNLTSLARRKSGEDSEHLTFYAFKLYDINGNPIGNTEEEAFKKLKELGFNVVEHFVGTLDEVWEWYEKTAIIRPKINYWLDGIICCANSIELQSKLGDSNNRPKSSIAIKFKAEKATSKLLAVKVQVGASGQICPVATIAPCQIGGATIESPTLHNYDEIERLDLYINDEIEIIKCNDIIPNISQVLKPAKNRIKIITPTHCPICNGKLEKRSNVNGDDSVNIYCVNSDCDAQIVGKVEKFVKSTDIQGIGTSVIEALLKNKLIESAADLYLLKNKENELADLILDKGTRFGEKRAVKLIEEIEKKRKLPLNEFLGSLGITSLGKRRVAIVIESLKGKMDSLTNWLDGVTLIKYANESSLPNVASNINDELIKKKDYILRFIKNGLSISASTKSTLKDGALIFVLSGTFPEKKEYYHKLIEQSGNGYSDTFSKSIDYLVVADPNSQSSKTIKAKKNGIKIIDQNELLKML